MADIKLAFGEDDAMRSIDLVEALNKDQERPWATWNKGKPLTQKQLAGLLKPFRIISTTVHIEGLADAKGYKRADFEEPWAAYLPIENPGQNHIQPPAEVIFPSKRPNADETGTSSIFPSVQDTSPDGSKNSNLSYSHAGLDVWTDRNTEKGAPRGFDQDLTLVCEHCGGPATASSPVQSCWVEGEEFLLHRDCQTDWLSKPDDLSIPRFLKREPGS